MKTYLVRTRYLDNVHETCKIAADYINYGVNTAQLQTSDNKIVALFPLDKLIEIIDLANLSKDKE